MDGIACQLSCLHHWILPFRSQKCDRQPVLRQTDGERLPRPEESRVSVQRGFASGSNTNSMVSPQPVGGLFRLRLLNPELARSMASWAGQEPD